MEKIGPSACCWTTSFGVRPDKELCGLKPLYSSLNNWIFSFASSSERNQLTFKHSSRKLPLKDSMNGLSVGFPGREKSSVTFIEAWQQQITLSSVDGSTTRYAYAGKHRQKFSRY